MYQKGKYPQTYKEKNKERNRERKVNQEDEIKERQTDYGRIIYIQIRNKVKKVERNKKEKTQKRKKEKEKKREKTKAQHACSMRSAASPNYNNL